MYTNNKLAKSVRLALMFGGASLAFTGTAAAQDQSEEAQAEEAQERIQVTGSRIKRTDLEGAVPLTVIDREAIELSGDLSVTDVLRGTTFNSFGSFRPQSGSSAQGTASIDMRGLGADRTLVLVDGRRLPKSPSTGSTQDLNTIPIGAVERIEILSDGASAVYGSDAIGGVINIVTRKDYSGAEISVGAGQVSYPEEGGDRENGTITFGAADANTSLLGGVSWNQRDIIFYRDFPYAGQGSSVYGNNWTPWSNYGVFTEIPNGCREPNYNDVTIGGRERCQYNFNATNANEASSANESLYLKGEHRINNNWKVYATATIAKTESFGRYAPVPDWAEIAPDSYNNPTNPDAWFYDTVNNPNAVAFDPANGGSFGNGPEWVDSYHRYAALGNRDGFVNNENTDLLVGGSGFIGDIELDFGLRRNRNKTYDIGYNYIVRSTANDYISNFNPGYCGDGSFDAVNCRYGYDIQNPTNNSDDVLNAMKATISRISKFDQDEAYLNASFDVAETDAGVIQAFVGAEYRKETYVDQYDSLSEAGQIGGSAGNSAGGDRTVKSAFFEVLVPVTMDFELNFAGRYDKYSDYGNDFSPKVSFRWEPTDGLVFRGSYGEGFRAPSLDILTAKTSFSAVSVNDADTCAVLGSCPVQVDTYIQSNPNLESEQSTQYALGVAYQPTDWLNMTVDYWSIEIDNRIQYYGPSTILAREAAQEFIPAGLGVTRNPTNNVITRVDAGYGNEGYVETDGIDLNARTNFDFGSIGALQTNVTVSYTNDYSLDGGRNFMGDPGLPEYRANIENLWTVSDFSFVWNMNIIGDQAQCGAGYEAVGNNCVTNAAFDERNGHWGTYVTHDFQANYATSWNGRITLGMQNAFEKLPQLTPYGGRDYNFDLYDDYGRITYFRYTQVF